MPGRITPAGGCCGRPGNVLAVSEDSTVALSVSIT